MEVLHQQQIINEMTCSVVNVFYTQFLQRQGSEKIRIIFPEI